MWIKYRTSIFVGISFSLLFSMLWFFQSLAFISFISLLLTLLLRSSVDRLTKKMPRLLASGIVLLTFIAVVITFLGMVSKTFIPTFAAFIADIPRISSTLQDLPIFHISDFITQEIESLLKEMTAFSISALTSSLSIIFSIFSKFIDLVIILFVTFYLLKDGDEIKNYMVGLFPTKDNSRILSLFNDILEALRTYIRSQLAICFITGIVVFLYFTIRDLPYASVFAAVSGISEFVPVVGPTLASAFGTILTTTQAPVYGAQTLLFYIVLTQVNHNIIYPYLIGKSLNLHPVAIILSIIFGGELHGAIGMFLAVPCMVIIKLVIEDICKDRQNIITK